MARSWQDWAQALINVLQGEERRGTPPLDLPAFPLAALPAPERDGQVIFVPDATGGGVPVFSRGGAWLRFDSGAAVS